MRRLLTVVALLCVLGSAQVARAKDVALVIGNDAYAHVPKLAKAVNDARSVAEALRRSGFTITQVENVDRLTMSRALVEFENALSEGDRALFYFSGHGFALGGSNYLLPIDVPSVEANQEGLIRDASFAVDPLADDIRQHGARVAILVLDACRNNPFATASTRSLPMTRGLARIETPEGSFVLTSAGPRQAALDSLSPADTDPNSVFTRIFLKELGPGKTLVDIAKHTQVAVRSLAATIGFEQMPAYSDQVVGDVVLAGPSAAGASAPAVAPDGPMHNVSSNVRTQIATSANTQGGAGVSSGTGVTIGPGVLIGGKDPKIALRTPGETGSAQVAAITPDTHLQGSTSGTAPIATFMRSNSGWSVVFSLAEPATAISYRIGAEGTFRDTGLMDTLDPRTGQRMPNPTIQLSNKAPATVIDVEYQRADGTTAGPFPIRFDPDVALFDSQRKALQQIWPSWVEFREYNGLLVYFTTLMSYRCAITEVRYGLDGAAPLTRFDLPPCKAADPFAIPSSAKIILKVAASTKSIGLQITWKDGTRSDVNTIER